MIVYVYMSHATVIARVLTVYCIACTRSMCSMYQRSLQTYNHWRALISRWRSAGSATQNFGGFIIWIIWIYQEIFIWVQQNLQQSWTIMFSTWRFCDLDIYYTEKDFLVFILRVCRNYKKINLYFYMFYSFILFQNQGIPFW